MTIKQKLMCAFIMVGLTFSACKNEPEKVKTNPVKELQQVDNLLTVISEKPQQFRVSSNQETIVTGKMGTIIHVDPDQLETVDGSSLGDQVTISLLELTDKKGLMLRNAQTVSNGKILVTGGAYYLNMTSNGKPLKIKTGKAIEVEFPKLTKDEMSLFLGEKDSLGQMNWVEAPQKFKNKDLKEPQKPKKGAEYSELDDMLAYMDSSYKPNPRTKEEIKEYERRKKEYKLAIRTYKEMELMHFGWINCDRFLNDPAPTTNINIVVQNDSVRIARFFAVFKDIKSIMTSYYWKGQENISSFYNIPIGKELEVIALSVKNKTPYIFETTIKASMNQEVKVNFAKTTQAEIRKKLTSIN